MCYYFNARTVRILLSLYQPINSQIYYTTVSLYMKYTSACSDISRPLSGNFVFESKLNKFLFLKFS